MPLKNRLRRPALKLLVKLNLAHYVSRLKNKKRFNLKNINRILKNGYISPPDRAKWELTVLCNLNCVMCHQKKRRKDAGKQLSLEQIKKIIGNLYTSGIRKLLFKGGEVFVRKDFFDILDYVESKGFRVNIISNGTMVNEKAAKKLNQYSNIDVITFSLDGLRETHNKIRGSNLAFDRTIKAIKLTSNRNFLIHIASVVQKDNLNEIPSLIKLCSGLKVDIISFTMEMFYNEKEINAAEKMLGQKTFFQPEKSSKYDFSFEQLKKVKMQIKKLGRKHGILTLFYPEIANDYLYDFYDGKLKNSLKFVCENFFEVSIDENGNVLGCPLLKSYHGNLLEKPFKEIWFSKDFREFRKKMFRYNLIPTCKKCCKLDFVR